MTLSVDDLIASAKPRTVKVEICARGDLVDRHGELVAELARRVQEPENRSIGSKPDEGLEDVYAEIEAVEAEQQEHTKVFELRSIGALAWNDMLRDHQPRAGLDTGYNVNMLTFPPAAVAACADPAITLEQAKRMYGEPGQPGVLHLAEWEKLFNAACSANGVATPHPKLPAAIGDLLQSVRSLTQAATDT